MNNTLKNILSYTLGAILVFSFVALAGTLTPGGNTSTPTMYTLSDIYSKIQNINFTPSAHTVSTSATVATTSFDLSVIYSALQTVSSSLTADKIATGTSIMGVTGTVVAAPAPLQWSAIHPGVFVEWVTAEAYCTGLGGGYRLPYLWEFAQYHQQNGQGDFLQDVNYWSSNKDPQNPDYDYTVYMLLDSVGVYRESTTEQVNGARCVR